MDIYDSKLTVEIETLKENFNKTADKLVKDIKRKNKIFTRNDKRQKKEYDELKALKAELEETQKEIIFIIGAISESRSKETDNHVKRVAEYSYILAKHYGFSENECQIIKQASPMHDIGKIGITDAILNKPARLSDDERAIMNTHAQLGYEILKVSNRTILKAAAIIAHEHHEKYNGTGYPNGLKGEDIHIYGRITALADVFDALGSDRIYKKAWSDDKIFKFFKEERGKHFDPNLVDIFFEYLDEFLSIRDSMKDTNLSSTI